MAEEKKGGSLVSAAQNLPVDRESMAAALKSSQDDNSTGGAGSMEYMSFSGKRGRYALGRDKKEPEADAVYILEPTLAVEGWECWKGSRPVKKHEWSLYERAGKRIRYDDLEDYGPYDTSANEGWKQTLGISFFDVDAPETQIKWTINSVSGRGVMSNFNGMVADDIMEGGDGVAVFTLGVEPFEAQGQRNEKPVIDVLAFVTRAEVEAWLESEGTVDDLISGNVDVEGAEPEQEPEPEPEPKGRRRRRKAA